MKCMYKMYVKHLTGKYGYVGKKQSFNGLVFIHNTCI